MNVFGLVWRYEMIQSEGVFDNLMEVNLSMTVVWEIVSKTALRLGRMKMKSSPESAVLMKFFIT